MITGATVICEAQPTKEHVIKTVGMNKEKPVRHEGQYPYEEEEQCPTIKMF
jgi:hypothetical protein